MKHSAAEQPDVSIRRWRRPKTERKEKQCSRFVSTGRDVGGFMLQSSNSQLFEGSFLTADHLMLHSSINLRKI